MQQPIATGRPLCFSMLFKQPTSAFPSSKCWEGARKAARAETASVNANQPFKVGIREDSARREELRSQSRPGTRLRLPGKPAPRQGGRFPHLLLAEKQRAVVPEKP